MLLRIAGPESVDAVDWDRIRFRRFDRRCWPTLHTVHMGDPLGFSRAAIGDIVDEGRSLDDVLAALRTSPPRCESTPTLSQWLQGEVQRGKENHDGNA
jgi:hypothetical protein